MSTDYYALKPPFTRVSLHVEALADRVELWSGAKYCGSLAVARGFGRHVLDMFVDHDSRVMRTHWGGATVGAVLTVHVDMPDDTTLIDSYGCILTARTVKARAGARRGDGWPTELAGYED